MINAVTNYFSEFKVLKTASRDFWLINLIQFLESLAYFSMISIVTLYLTTNGGFSDFESGKWVSVYTLFITAFVFAVGSVCDVIGIKRSLFIGIGLLIVARAGLGLTPVFLGQEYEQFAIIASLIILSLGTAFMSPVTQTALRRFTSKVNRPTGFNIYYLLMNISAIIANSFIVDYFRNKFGASDGNLWIMNIGLVATITAFFFSSFINENNFAEEEERLETKETRRPLAIFLEVWKERPFQKLVLFLFLTIGVRIVFTNQFLIMPKYYTRVLYEDFDLGLANSINPLIIVLGLIAIIPIINKYSTIKLMILGMAISASSLLVMCIPIHFFLHIPGVNSLTEVYLAIIIIQILVFAIGELIFMPRFTEYIASVAPKEKVTSYMSLAALPMFIAKPFNGFISGILITLFCYDGIKAKIETHNIAYQESPEFMWLIYCILAIMSPLVVIAMRRFLEQKTEPPTHASVETALEESASFMELGEQGAEVASFTDNNKNRPQ